MILWRLMMDEATDHNKWHDKQLSQKALVYNIQVI